MSNRRGALVLFTLSPGADGKRKSLAPEVVAALISRVQSVASAVEGVDLLVATPSRAPEGTSPLRHLRQRGRGFGESLRLAVEDAFDLGYRSVVVIGNDAPEISASYLTRAFEALASGVTQAVLGPASDGGYNLIGLSRPCAGAFDSIPWGSSGVCELTESRLHREGFDVQRLETVSDVDGPKDLERLLRRLRGQVDPALRSLGRELGCLIESVPARIQGPVVSPVPAPARIGLLRAPPV